VKASIEAELKEKKRSREDPEFQSLAGVLRLINESLDEVDDSDAGDLAILKLKQLVMLEQSLVTGVEWLGKDRARLWDKTHQSSDVLKLAIDENTSNQLRLLGLMMLSYRRLGVDRDAVLTAKSCLQLPEERFTNIQKLLEVPPPISLSPDPQSDVKQRKSMDVGFAKGCINEDAALDLNFPAIAQITDQFVRDVLPDDEFPYVQKRLMMPPSPPARDAAVPTHFRAYMRTRDAIPDAKDKPVFTGGRFYVVVLGGATDTERRYISEISRHSGREIVLISTSFPTPLEYMENAGRIQFD